MQSVGELDRPPGALGHPSPPHPPASSSSPSLLPHPAAALSSRSPSPFPEPASALPAHLQHQHDQYLSYPGGGAGGRQPSPATGAGLGARPPLPQSYSTSAMLPQRNGANASPYGPPPPPPPSMGGPAGGYPQQGDTRTQLFVSNLPFRVRWQDLKDLMRKCGTVLRADVALSPTDGRSRGFGVVLFARAEDAAKAIQTYHGYTWQTRVLDVRIDAQDPTGALALAEANRQQAMQQQQRQMERRGASPVPHPGQPMMLQGGAMGYPGPQGTMLVPVASPMGGQAFLAPPPAPPPLSSNPSSQQQPPPPSGSPEHQLRPSSSAGLNGASSSSPFLSPSAPVGSSTSPSPSPALPPAFLPPSLERSASSGVSRNDSPSRSPAVQPSAIPPPPPPAAEHPPPPPPPPPHHSHSYPQPPPHHPQQNQITYMQVPVMNLGGGMQVPLVQGMPFSGPLGGGVGVQMVQVQTGGVHPMGYALPAGGGGGGGGVHGGLMSYYAAQQQRPQSSPLPAHYTNRHLFIGNLPFNCQWQELKDLMRGAGSVLRADIAQGPDGRSRGFGSVLFATPQDAERAVAMFNGFEFNGRALKVHFDKFSGQGINGGNNGNGRDEGRNGSYNNNNNNRDGGGHGSPHPFVMPVPVPAYQRTVSGFEQQQQQQHYYPHQQQPQRDQSPHPLSQQHQHASSSSPLFAHQVVSPNSEDRLPLTAATEVRPSSSALSPYSSSSIVPEAAPRPSTATEHRPSTSGAPGDGAPPLAASAPASSPTLVSSSLPPASIPSSSLPHSQQHPHTNKPHHPLAPSRIAMPPPVPFTGGAGPFSPLHTRNLPPMTPSMPAFTFAPFAAPTPPLHPHALFSPGIGMTPGPFSPGIGGPGAGGSFFGSPTAVPGTGGGGGAPPQTPGWAQTPGAGMFGLHGGGGGAGHNPMFPPFGGGERQRMPSSGQHFQPPHGFAQQVPPPVPVVPVQYQQEQLASATADGGGEQGEGQEKENEGPEPSYFPPIAELATPPSSSHSSSPSGLPAPAAAPPPSFGSGPPPPSVAHKSASDFPPPSSSSHELEGEHSSSSAPTQSPEEKKLNGHGRPALHGHSKSDGAGGGGAMVGEIEPLEARLVKLSLAAPATKKPQQQQQYEPEPVVGWAEGSPSTLPPTPPPVALAPPATNGHFHSHAAEEDHKPSATAKQHRRRSFIPPGEEEEVRTKFEAGAGVGKEGRDGFGLEGGTQGQGRRASFDAGNNKAARPAFGTSIWG
ncbi:hypothetical protein JCM8547_009051 [Rhodosporidiobolus lusitaniae]